MVIESWSVEEDKFIQIWIEPNQVIFIENACHVFEVMSKKIEYCLNSF